MSRGGPSQAAGAVRGVAPRRTLQASGHVSTEGIIAVTGASGFIGRAFCARAARSGRALTRFVRTPIDPGRDVSVDLASANVGMLTDSLRGVATLVHLAGRAHVMHDTARDAHRLYREANEHATRTLAEAAVAAGVHRFIFASSVKVNGEATPPGRAFRPGDSAAPQDAYARSKFAAETALFEVANGTPMRAIVLRLPLVYGAGARGNFRRLVDAVRARRWLPFGALDNRRSLIGIENLLDALDAALDAPTRFDGVHFVADADSVSPCELVRAIGGALQTRPRLVPVPAWLLRAAGLVSGQREAMIRITSTLEVDTSSYVAATGWTPRRFSIDAAAVAGEPSASI